MFERYTEKARRLIFFARYEASQLGSPYIETEHLLLGLFREARNLIHKFIPSEAAIKDIREEIERYADKREKVATSVDLPLSNESKRVLAYAAEESERLSHKHIGTEHLLLGILREEKCFGAELLRQQGIQLATARTAIKDISSESQKEESQSTGTSRRQITLADFGSDLTEAALNGSVPPLIGRDHELTAVMRVLCRSTKANPVLVGERGVGKRAIVHGLAHRLAQARIPSHLLEKRLIALDLAVIASGTSSRASFEQNVENILKGFQGSDMLLFIDGLHTLAQTVRFLNVLNVLKPGLQSGAIRCVSTAIPAEYGKAMEAAPWLEKLFTAVEVRPATEAQALEILRGRKKEFEDFHGVSYTDEALQYAVFHSNSYFHDRFLPEKAIDLMDEAGAHGHLVQPALPDEVLEAQKKVKLIEDRHNNAIQNHEFEKARFYSDELNKERESLRVLREEHKVDEKAAVTVTRDDIESIVAERTGISVEALRKSRIPQA
jgi:ATP-dependent Clp protease ATP-binding subunit ClpC